ncbi:MAG: TIGR02099 family protein, partial [Gallionella sp.]|nr:TIGR02099 family protein [Gallionella sp.]
MLKTLLRHTALGTWYAARIAVLFVIVSMAAGVAFLQFSIFPGIERFHGDIELAASTAIGRPLKIERIEADWDGWRPSLLLTGVSIRDDQRRVALELPSMRNTVAWSSLLLAELRFHSLQLDNPQLLIRRDVSGRLYVGGIESDP